MSESAVLAFTKRCFEPVDVSAMAGETVRKSGDYFAIFYSFLKLGLTAFGGPVAHLGYFRTEFVIKRRWLAEQDYAELVALCQFLPGPTSSQAGMAIGLLRGGYVGALLAWLGFTLPSALLLMAVAIGLQQWSQWFSAGAGLVHGLKIVAVAVVIQAIYGMMLALCNTKAKLLLTFFLLVMAISLSSLAALAQPVVISLGAIAGWLWLAQSAGRAHQSNLDSSGSQHKGSVVTEKSACWFAVIFAVLLLAPLLLVDSKVPWMALFEMFYRAGALVFGGGHVVLPLLQAEVVPAGLVSQDVFMAGYAAAQAVPGPLFTFAGFVGTSMPAGNVGDALFHGGIALIAVFLPGFLLLCASWPFWLRLRSYPSMQAALAGIGCSVVALLAAVLYQPIWHSTVQQPLDLLLVLLALMSLLYWKISPLLLVAAGALVGLFWL